MPEHLDLYRKALERRILRSTGSGSYPINETLAKQIGARHEGQFSVLPAQPVGWQPIQDMDPASPTFGQVYSLADDPADVDPPL